MNVPRKIILLMFLTTTYFWGQQGFSSFYNRNEFLFTSPGALKYGLYGYANPALLTYVENFNFMFDWTNQNARWNDLKNWGLFTSIPNLGFGLVHKKIENLSITDYKLSTGFGNRSLSMGMGYGWSSGNEDEFGRTNILTIGILSRPVKYISVGLVGTTSTEINSQEGYVDLAVRPFGDEKITLFGDYAVRSKAQTGINKNNWSAGAVIEVLPGLRITGRYFDTKDFTTGIDIGLGNLGLKSQVHYDKEGKYAYNTYGIRVGGYDRNLLTKIIPSRNYLEVNLLGKIKYQRYKFFDKSNTLYSVTEQIDAAKEDKSILGIAINTSGMQASREMLWEIRDRLKEFKAGGKKVVIFIDNPDISTYHFASVADKIVMDPVGTINILGFLAGRTYYKNALDRIGVGIDEHRFFKYKSAVENYSRTNMSKPDSLQNQVLIDDYYETARKEICEGRNFTHQQFDNLVNEYGAFIAAGAIEKKLVDTLARWDSVPEIISKMEEENMGMSGSVEKFDLPKDNYWGEPKKIAVVYALGVCAMDEGITARKLVNDLTAVMKDPLVKAVVLRVDSPGGDGMASDYIAEVIKKYKKLKPVIVSQGSVAASGGYWLSMYGDTIIAAPITITGSIGVISLWVYNKGLKEKIGFSTDFVKRGEHADLPFGMTIPFIGVTLPDRNLTKDERDRLESYIKSMYQEFVDKVAQGRKLSTSYVDSIGQGRVWSGLNGKKNGLVDILGGIDDAIRIARMKAGIKEDEPVSIVQLPVTPLIDLSFLTPKLFGVEIKEDEFIKNLKFRLENFGRPMPILPLEEMDLIK
jgi:protease-4